MASQGWNEFSQHGFRNSRSCFTNLISFYDQATLLVDDRKVVDIHLDLSKIFDTVSHSNLLEKLAAHSLDRCSLQWVKNSSFCIFPHLILPKPSPFHWLWSPKHLRSLVQYWDALPCTPQQNPYPWAVSPVCGVTRPASLLTPGADCTQWGRSRGLSAPSWLWGWDFHSLMTPVIVTKRLNHGVIWLPTASIAPLGSVVRVKTSFLSHTLI